MKSIFLYIVKPEFMGAKENLKGGLTDLYNFLKKSGWNTKTKNIENAINNNENQWDGFVCRFDKGAGFQIDVLRVFPCWVLKIYSDRKEKEIESLKNKIENYLPLMLAAKYRVISERESGALKVSRQGDYVKLSHLPDRERFAKLDAMLFDLKMSNIALNELASKWNKKSEEFRPVYKIGKELEVLSKSSLPSLSELFQRLSFSITEFKQHLDFSKHAVNITLRDIKFYRKQLTEVEGNLLEEIERSAEKNTMLLSEIEAHFNRVFIVYKNLKEQISYRAALYSLESSESLYKLLGVLGMVAIAAIVIVGILF